MEKSLIVQNKEFSESDIQLIKQTVAKGATDSELKLFLYRAKVMGLDPLKPGQLFFVKYGNNPGTIVVGLDGFRALAGRTGKHAGTRRGLLKDESGKCTGAWCEVYRIDWQHPAREEVSLSEYNTGRAQWAKMPETMIRKVAETAALRMAFPDELGGVYSEDEMSKTTAQETRTREVQEVVEETELRPEFESVIVKMSNFDGPGDYVFKTGNSSRKGKYIKECGLDHLQDMLIWFDESKARGKVFEGDVEEDFQAIKTYLESK